jgi:hypothetical protein
MNRIEPIGPTPPGTPPVSRPTPGERARRSTERDAEGGDRRDRGAKRPRPDQPRADEGRLDVRA